MRIAVIGTGISGSAAARLLSLGHDVTVFEGNPYAGGHANTVDVKLGKRDFAVDTGFMVFNRKTYPNFCRLLALLQIPARPSDMSFSVRSSRSGIEYQGSSLDGLFAQRRNLFRPAFLKMLADILRFNRIGSDLASKDSLPADWTVRDLLQECRCGRRFVDDYFLPMTAAIWSAQPDSILDFPARFMLGFLANHGLMQISNRPQWLTIPGGSRSYVRALLAPLGDSVRLAAPVSEVRRTDKGVSVTTNHGDSEQFDNVVLATHADQSLKILSDATPLEQQILSCFPYQANEAVLHTDTALMPTRRRAWASWNYHIHTGSASSATLTYDLGRLQGLDTPTPLLSTLNETQEVDPSTVLRRFVYSHPAYSLESIEAQGRHSEISGQHRVHFCGAYWGYGFHEDGLNSALAVARQFGIGLEDLEAQARSDDSAAQQSPPFVADVALA